MATQAYYRWVAAGRPWKLAAPIAHMIDVAKRHGIAVLGTIGADDETHLQSSFPEDHCPFSYTFWPVEAYPWVCAADLANDQGLGEALLRDARAGKAEWLKYINFANKMFTHEDGFRVGQWNADQHVHISCRSDWVTRDVGDYDPLAASPTPEDAVTEEQFWNLVGAIGSGSTGRGWVSGTAPAWAQVYGRFNIRAVLDKLAAMEAAEATRDAGMLAAIKALTVATGADPAPILAAIREQGEATRTAVLEKLAAAARAEAEALKG